MPRPFCVKCGRAMRASRIGIAVEFVMEDGRPYQVWAGDEFRCESCGATVVTGYGRKPITEHFERNFQTVRDAHKANGILISERAGEMIQHD